MAKKMNTTASATLANLRECDHGFLTAEAVQEFNVGFGLAPDAIKPYKAYANPRDPKGLTFDNGAKSGIGYDAAEYAEQVSTLLGTGFKPWQMGRGSRLRSACDAIEAHLNGICQAYYDPDSSSPGPRCAHAKGHQGAHYFPGIDDKGAT